MAHRRATGGPAPVHGRRNGGGRRGSAALLTLAVLAAGAAGCSHDDPPAAKAPTGTPPANPAVVNQEEGAGGTLRLGVVAPDTIDPAQIVPTDPAEAITADLLFDGLTTIDPQTGEAIPALAEAWDADEKLEHFRFHLRPGATFSDGSPITATDVKYSLERVVLRGKLSLAGPRLDIVAGFKEVQAGTATELSGLVVRDDRTLQIDLVEAYAGLPELLASPSFGVVSKRAFTSGLPLVLLSGPFTLASRDATKARLERRPGAEAKLDAVEIIHYTSDTGAWDAFRSGEVNWVLVPPTKHDEAVATYGEAAFTPLGATSFIAFNLVNPKFVDPRFRRAILLALDRDKLAAAVPTGRVAQRAIVPPGVPGALAESCGTPCRTDVEEARKILTSLYPNGVYPSVQVAVPEGGPEKLVADEVLRELAEVGIPVVVAVKTFDEYRSYSTSGQQELFWYGWAGLFPDPDAYLGRLFLTASKDNVTGYHSEDVDTTIRQARAERERTVRWSLYRDLERKLMDDAVIIPVSAYRLEAVVSAKVRNFRWRLDGTFVTTDVWVKP